ncbi:MAG: hypothetical protein JXL20_00980 [Deltaproteobacteria bacterium]|nr:hypothetical protein [Deltaproteobacteria bacterium]
MLKKILFWGIICLVIEPAGPLFAVPPLNLPPENYSVYSSSTRYRADVSVSGKVDVLRIDDNGRRIFCYSMAASGGAKAYISDDGEKFVMIRTSINKNDIKNFPVVKIWVHGTLSRQLYLHEIWDFNISKPAKSMEDFYYWYREARFLGSNRFIIQLLGDHLKPQNDQKYVIELE